MNILQLNLVLEDWLKLSQSVFSWPVICLVIVIIFRKLIFNVITNLSTGVTKAKLGPLEIEMTTLSEKIDMQKSAQEQLTSEVKTLSFLITNFVTEPELIHLQNLSKPTPFMYEKNPYFENELRRLRALGLINNYPNQGIRKMPQTGDLKTFFFITESGQEYLNLRKS
jgi:hypothetical protein